MIGYCSTGKIYGDLQILVTLSVYWYHLLWNMSEMVFIIPYVLQVLAEFDDGEWKRREWVKIYTTFQVFLVETSLVYAQKGQAKWCPALVGLFII